MQKGRGERRESACRQQRERDQRGQEAVYCVGRVNGCEGRQNGRRRDDTWNIGAGYAGKIGGEITAPRELTDNAKAGSECSTHCDSDARADKACFDAIADHKYATKRERDAADPNQPFGAKGLLH